MEPPERRWSGDADDVPPWSEEVLSWSDGLLESEPGVFTTATPPEAVSYPGAGHIVNESIERTSFWFQHRNAAVLATIARFPPAGVLLDLGGGTGLVSAALSGAGQPVVLLEPTEVGVRAAQRKGGFPIIHARFQDMGLRAGSLAAVGMFDVIEHIEDDVEFLSSLTEGLVRGGRIYLTVPAHRWLWSAADERAGHYRRYTRDTLVSTVRRAGYRVLFDSYFFSFLPPAILVGRTLADRLASSSRSHATRTSGQHTLPAGPAGRALRWIMSRELARLRSGRIPVGASLMLVAERE